MQHSLHSISVLFKKNVNINKLLKGHILARARGAYAGHAVFDDFSGGGELAEVVANHFGGNGEGEEFLAIVDSEADIEHFREDDHIAAVSADGSFVLEVLGSYFTDFFEEANMAGREATEEGAALA